MPIARRSVHLGSADFMGAPAGAIGQARLPNTLRFHDDTVFTS